MKVRDLAAFRVGLFAIIRGTAEVRCEVLGRDQTTPCNELTENDAYWVIYPSFYTRLEMVN